MSDLQRSYNWELSFSFSDADLIAELIPDPDYRSLLYYPHWDRIEREAVPKRNVEDAKAVAQFFESNIYRCIDSESMKKLVLDTLAELRNSFNFSRPAASTNPSLSTSTETSSEDPFADLIQKVKSIAPYDSKDFLRVNNTKRDVRIPCFRGEILEAYSEPLKKYDFFRRVCFAEGQKQKEIKEVLAFKEFPAKHVSTLINILYGIQQVETFSLSLEETIGVCWVLSLAGNFLDLQILTDSIFILLDRRITIDIGVEARQRAYHGLIFLLNEVIKSYKSLPEILPIDEEDSKQEVEQSGGQLPTEDYLKIPTRLFSHLFNLISFKKTNSKTVYYIPEKTEQALLVELLEKVASRDPIALPALAEFYLESDTPNFQKGIDLLQEAIGKNEPSGLALKKLGECFLVGRGVKKDLLRGMELLRQAHEKTCIAASITLATIYRIGFDTIKPNRKKQSEIVETLNYSNAFTLDSGLWVEKGLYYVENLRAQKDVHTYRKVTQIFQEAVACSNHKALFEWGSLLLSNRKVSHNDSTIEFAIELWERAWLLGSSQARFELGKLFLNVAPYDDMQLKKAIQRGIFFLKDGIEIDNDDHCRYQLAEYYLHEVFSDETSLGVPKKEEIIELLQQAFANGLTKAGIRLADIHSPESLRVAVIQQAHPLDINSDLSKVIHIIHTIVSSWIHQNPKELAHNPDFLDVVKRVEYIQMLIFNGKLKIADKEELGKFYDIVGKVYAIRAPFFENKDKLSQNGISVQSSSLAEAGFNSVSNPTSIGSEKEEKKADQVNPSSSSSSSSTAQATTETAKRPRDADSENEENQTKKQKINP